MMRSIIRAVALSLLLSLAAFSAHAQSLPVVTFSTISLATTNSTLVSGAGQNILKWIVASNTTATAAVLKVYNKSTAPTCGTDIPVLRLPIPANTNGGGVTALSFDDTRFTLGIGFCVTNVIADNDTGAAPAGIAINFGYLWQ